MDTVCPLEITQQEYDDIKKCEAVVIREYEREDGSRIGKVVAWGDADEMQDQADTSGIFVVPVGLSIVCQQMVLVSDLLGAEQTDPRKCSVQSTEDWAAQKSTPAT